MNLGYQKRLAEKFNKQVLKYGSDIEYFKYDPSTERNHYGETLGTKYLPPETFRVIFKIYPSRDDLEEFGMDLNTEVIVRIPYHQLEEKGIEPFQNDKIVLNGIDYFVHQVSGQGHIRNLPIFVAVGCQRGAYTNGK